QAEDGIRDLIVTGVQTCALPILRVALTVTGIELLIGYPFAIWLAKGCRSKGLQSVILSLLTIPFFLDISSRTIVWRAILDQHGRSEERRVGKECRLGWSSFRWTE